MSFLLHIDTAQPQAQLALSKDGQICAVATQSIQKEHATWLHPALDEMIRQEKLEWSSVDAVAVTEGPGSYTGLRVGLAAAKGLCFALQKPLILVNSLDILADAMRAVTPEALATALWLPLIDARRMEVFAAVYDNHGARLEAPFAWILTAEGFDRFEGRPLYLGGDGAAKSAPICPPSATLLTQPLSTLKPLVERSWTLFLAGQFAHAVDAEPCYVKNFHFNG